MYIWQYENYSFVDLHGQEKNVSVGRTFIWMNFYNLEDTHS